MVQKCRHCSRLFEITEEDLQFYDKISPVFAKQKYPVPSPTLCPECRQQRRLTWRNEQSFYSRACDLCKKPVISTYSLENRFPIYCNKCWWGDSWDPKKYAREFDFSKPFFEQFYAFRQEVPQLAIMNDDGIGSENCAYCQDYAFGKNCYFLSGSWYSEDSFYSNSGTNHCRFASDCMDLKNSELVYECMSGGQLYHCAFVENSENCNDCFFGFDLKGCSNCFGCVGLRHKQFHLFNQPYSEVEYREKLAVFGVNTHSGLERAKKQYWEWMLQFPRKNMILKNCEACEGSYLYDCRHSYGFMAANADHCKFIYQTDTANYSYDLTTSGHNQWCYEGDTPDDSYMALFTLWCWKSKNILYSDNCHSSGSLFGCISMHRAEHCIFNKQYTTEEYEQLAGRIIEHMKQTGEWGEFFPSAYSAYGYNESVADEYFPLDKETILQKGWRWREPDPKEYLPQKVTIPDAIEQVSEAILKEIFACETCGHNFRIIAKELDFYRKMGLPLPLLCAHCRHKARLKRTTAYQLWDRLCAKCQKPIKTAYAPERPEIIFCEECFMAN